MFFATFLVLLGDEFVVVVVVMGYGVGGGPPGGVIGSRMGVVIVIAVV